MTRYRFVFLSFFCFFSAGLPPWAFDQIEEDFSPTLRISEKDIENSYSAIKKEFRSASIEIVKVKVEGGSLFFSEDSPQSGAKLLHFKKSLSKALEGLSLPPFSFLLSLNKSFERPLFLRHLKVPIFAVSKHYKNQKVILLPNNCLKKEEFFEDSTPWSEKIPRALFVGEPSLKSNYYEWSLHPRAQLLFLKERLFPEVDGHFIQKDTFKLLPSHTQKSMLGAKLFGPSLSEQELFHYRFLISLDKETTSDELPLFLYSKSCVLKERSPYIEWYDKGLIAFTHYIPISSDFSDLNASIRSATDGEFIAENGREFAEKYLSEEASTAYLREVFKAYSSRFE
ncbi:MAG: glycosyl transferase family 90 [Simkaniaceae bacterium]